MKQSEKVFGRLASNPSFKKDILFLNKLSNKFDQILKTYLKSQYREFFHYGDEFAKLIDLPIKDSHRLWHLLDLFGYSIVPNYETDDIIEALNEITEIKLSLKTFIEKLKDEKSQDLLKELDLINDEIGKINPHYAKLIFNIQERKVFKDNKVIKNFPIITLQIATSSEESDENVFELLEEDVDRIIDEFNDIKRKLKILKEEIK